MTTSKDATYQLYVGSEIDGEAAAELINHMADFHEEDPTAFWDVVINCEGGSTEAGSAVAMTLRSYSDFADGGHFITTIATGQCSSMATLIAQMGDWRVTDVLCVWVFHEPSTGVFESTLTNIVADINCLRKWQSKVIDLLLERSKMTKEQYQLKIEGRNWFVMADELLELGFVDEVRR